MSPHAFSELYDSWLEADLHIRFEEASPALTCVHKLPSQAWCLEYYKYFRQSGARRCRFAISGCSVTHIEWHKAGPNHVRYTTDQPPVQETRINC
jgi:hypothetical protein